MFSCCPAWIDDHDIGRYDSGADIFEIWNSAESQAIRASIFDGSFKFCSTKLCPRLHDPTTLDDEDDILAGRHGERLRNIYENRRTVVSAPDYLNLCFDLSCNLSCPSCRKELISVRKDHPKYEQKRRLEEQLLESIHRSDQPVRVSVTGSGDPFASRLFFDFLRRLDLNRNPNIVVTLQTNGVLFDEPHWRRLGNIHACKHIDAYISLDAGCEATYRQTRRGGNWTKLMRNLDFIAGLRDSGVLKCVRLDMVVQDNNFRDIPDFIGIARQHDFHCELMPIVNWGTFDDEEFARKNIFYLGHPEHAEFHRVMRFAGGLREALPRQPLRVCPPRVGGPVPYAPLAGHDPGQAGPPAEVLGSAVFT